MKACPFCAEEIQDAAVVCRFCQADLAAGKPASRPAGPVIVAAPPANTPNRGVAALLSLVIPGAGQMYVGRVGMGLVWLVCTVIGYTMFVFPGLIIHVFCIVNAAASARAAAEPPPASVDRRNIDGNPV